MWDGMGFNKLLKPMLNVFNQTKDAGRPQSADSDLSESGEETRNNGSNLDRGGNV